MVYQSDKYITRHEIKLNVPLGSNSRRDIIIDVAVSTKADTQCRMRENLKF